LQSVF